jgi:hypothetical protein
MKPVRNNIWIVNELPFKLERLLFGLTKLKISIRKEWWPVKAYLLLDKHGCVTAA